MNSVSLSRLPVQTLMVSLQPQHAIACFNIYAHLKNHKHRQSYHGFGHKIWHKLLGMGNATRATAVPYLGKVT